MFDTPKWTTRPMPPFLAYPHRVVRHFLPSHAGHLRAVVLTGLAASLLNAAGYLALHPLLDHLTGNQAGIVLGPWQYAPSPALFAAVVAVVVGLLAGSLQLRYRAHSRALAVFRDGVRAAATVGLPAIRRLPMPDDGRRPAQYLYRATQEITGPVAFACGYTMKQLALGLADLVQLVVFTAILAWLSPWLTLAFLASVAGVGVFYARSARRVAEQAGERSALAKAARAELRELGSELADPACGDDALRGRVDDLYSRGAWGRLLVGRLDVRKEIKRAPLVIEYLFPVALVVLPVVALATGSFKAVAGNLVVYLLLLRQAIASLQAISAQLISIGRYQPQLVCFSDLLDGSDAPRCRFRHQDGQDTELDDPAD